MRLLFISGTTTGGSGRSQRELAARLAEKGHDVRFLVDDGSPERLRRFVYEQLADLSARVSTRPGSRVVRFLERKPGGRTRTVQMTHVEHHITPIPENAALDELKSFRPDVVIGSSVLRLAWRKIRSMCDARGIPTVLYIREEEALNHFANGVLPADAVVANAESLAAEIRRQGFECAFIPSVIEVEVTLVEPTRRAVLVINPIESRGIETVWKVAARLPEIPFIVQESWPLEPDQLEAVRQHVARLPNVEFRRLAPPGPQLYRDARVLLVPYRIANRPRVIAEAQANGIPVIVGDVPALVEAIGGGGLQVPLDDIGAWCAAIELTWNDPERYEVLSAAAVQHSKRSEIDPRAVATSFERIVNGLVAGHATG